MSATKRVKSIGEEIQQTKPFRSLSMEATLGLLRTAEVIRRYFEETVAPSGLSLTQYNVLRILRGAGEQGLPTLEIANRLVERAPGVTRLVDRLEAKGFVARERCGDDRRIVYCRITGTGRRLLRTLDERVNAADDEALAMLKVREQRQLVELLDRIRAGHEASPDPEAR